MGFLHQKESGQVEPECLLQDLIYHNKAKRSQKSESDRKLRVDPSSFFAKAPMIWGEALGRRSTGI